MLTRPNIRVTATGFRTIRTVSGELVTSAEITFRRDGVSFLPPHREVLLVVPAQCHKW